MDGDFLLPAYCQPLTGNLYESESAYYTGHIRIPEATMRVNVVIDDVLMARAMKLSKLKTKKSVIEAGVRLLVGLKDQEQVRWLRGKVEWTGARNRNKSSR